MSQHTHCGSGSGWPAAAAAAAAAALLCKPPAAVTQASGRWGVQLGGVRCVAQARARGAARIYMVIDPMGGLGGLWERPRGF